MTTAEVDAKGTRPPAPGSIFDDPVTLTDVERALMPKPQAPGLVDRGVRQATERLMASAEAMHEPLHMPDTIAEGRTVGDPIDALIAERGKIHGNFTDHARVTQTFKTVGRLETARRAERDQPSLTPEMVEALDMIYHKIGRIYAGEADFRDHWDDIAGYARLVAERCSK